MTDIELHQLATEYAEQNPPADIKDEVLKGNLIGLNAEIFENFLIWLTKSHCIVSREKVRELYDCYKQHEAVTNQKGLHEAMIIARGSVAAFRDIFGSELFKERSEE